MRIQAAAFLLLLALAPPAVAEESKKEPQANAEPRIEMQRYYMVFLRRGPAWTAERTAESAAIGKGHMDNIRRLADEGKLVIAGPFLDQTDPRALAGLFIFRVDTMEEARALTETDPAVKAGRFTYEILPWLGPKTLGY